MTTIKNTHKSTHVFRWTSLLAIGVLISMFLAGPALPMYTGTAVSEASSHKMPPGQLTRKTLSGIVTANDGSSISVSTRFGTVLVGVLSTTVVDAPPDKNVGIKAVTIGSRVVVQLNRSPLEKAPDGTDGTGGDGTTGGNATTTNDGTAGGNATTTDDDTTGGAATTTDTGTTGSTEATDGSATTTDTGTGASSTSTAFAMPADPSDTDAEIALVLSTGGLEAGTIVVGGLGISRLAVRGIVLQVATTTDTGSTTTTDHRYRHDRRQRYDDGLGYR